MLGIILGAYREFKDRIQLVVEAQTSKPDRIRNLIKNSFGKMFKLNWLIILFFIPVFLLS